MNPTESITARFVWTVDDLMIGRKYFARFRKTSLIGIVLFVAGAVFVGSNIQRAYIGNDVFETVAGIALTILLGVIIGVPLARMISSFLIRRQFSKRPDAGMEIIWEISEAGISTSSALSKSEIQWSAFQKVVATPAGFLFMPNVEIFHFIPNRAFENKMKIERLKELARRYAAQFKDCG